MTELDEIREDYDAGRLEDIKRDLERFVIVHRGKIEAFRKEQETKGLPPLSDEVALKFYIIRHRTINPGREIHDQLREIEREKWIRGIASGREPDPQEVALDWAKNHSAGWRAHRVTTIIYCFDRDKDRYLRLLKTPPATAG
ncbi:MAG: hypothetical protein HYY16_13315 [Planctomycetes bacterium]|nr:hypothetical protein [Planctomycetota bacterium]